MEPIIRIENLGFTYDLYEDNQSGELNFKQPIPALKNVNLSFISSINMQSFWNQGNPQ